MGKNRLVVEAVLAATALPAPPPMAALLPDPTLTYAKRVVERYWDGIRLMADALLGLLVLAVAGEILLGVRLGQTYAGSLERFWRLLLVAALANGSLAMIGQAIDLSNLDASID